MTKAEKELRMGIADTRFRHHTREFQRTFRKLILAMRKAIIAEEREACAKVAETVICPTYDTPQEYQKNCTSAQRTAKQGALTAAAAIRGRK